MAKEGQESPAIALPQFAGFYASCQELASGAGQELASGAGQMLQPVAVQMFRVLVNTEGAAQAGGMLSGGGDGGDGGGGYGQPLTAAVMDAQVCESTADQ